MLPHLAAELLRARVDAGIDSARTLGRMVRRDHSSLSAIERGDQWPRDVEGTVAIYAELAGITPLEMWERVLARWARASSSPEAVALAKRLRA